MTPGITMACACLGTPAWSECCGKTKLAELGLADVFAEALAGMQRRAELRAEHRRSCTRLPCDRCELWTCARCAKPTDVPADDRDGSRRPALCEACLRQWHRDRLLAPSLASIPSDFYREIVPSREGAKLMEQRLPSYKRHRERLIAIAKRPGSCVLAGPTRTGKTLLACYMLRLVIEIGRDLAATSLEVDRAKGCLFVSAEALARAKAAHPLGKGDPPLVRQALCASVLILDDCGQEDTQGAHVIRGVLMARDRRPTWVTTFLSREGGETFAARYGGGAESRLIEAGTWVDL